MKCFRGKRGSAGGWRGEDDRRSTLTRSFAAPFPPASITRPYLFLNAGNDADNCKTGGSLVALNEKFGGSTFEYKEMVHGWFSRGDTTVEEVKRDVKDAMERAVEFLGKFMVKD